LLEFRIRYTTKDGEVGVLINQVKYVYHIDAGYLPGIESLAKLRPGEGLNLLKKLAHHWRKDD